MTFGKIHRYLLRVTPERPAILKEMEAYAAEHNFPIIGPLVGRFLFQLAILTKARRIMELGSGFGYSAFWFSLATGSRGQITLTDTDRENKRKALDYFKRAGLKSHFDFKVGEALRTLRRTDGPFDIILNDINKEDYPKTIDLVADRLRKGGLFISDNLIWSGRICDRRPDKATQAILEFTHRLYEDSRFFTTIMPIRDGLAVAVRR
ncbi:MAG: O-methyltransferase [Candidatus Zixiibacteriota bacterium]